MSHPGYAKHRLSKHLCLVGQPQPGHIHGCQSWHIQTMSSKAFHSLWGREAESLWQIWYRTWHAVHVHTISAAKLDIISHGPIKQMLRDHNVLCNGLWCCLLSSPEYRIERISHCMDVWGLSIACFVNGLYEDCILLIVYMNDVYVVQEMN